MSRLTFATALLLLQLSCAINITVRENGNVEIYDSATNDTTIILNKNESKPLTMNIQGNPMLHAKVIDPKTKEVKTLWDDRNSTGANKKGPIRLSPDSSSSSEEFKESN